MDAAKTTTIIRQRFEAGETMPQIATDLGLAHDDDTITVPGVAISDVDDIYLYDTDDKDDAVSEYVDSGDWGECNETRLFNVYAGPIVIGEDGETDLYRLSPYTVEIPPDVPECERGHDHRWVRTARLGGPAWGSGGGVRFREICPICGCVKAVDTWATNPDDGSQGHTVERYLTDETDLADYLARVESGGLWVEMDEIGECGRVTIGQDEDTGLWAVRVDDRWAWYVDESEARADAAMDAVAVITVPQADGLTRYIALTVADAEAVRADPPMLAHVDALAIADYDATTGDATWHRTDDGPGAASIEAAD